MTLANWNEMTAAIEDLKMDYRLLERPGRDLAGI
jgi:hypothetical protein